MADTFACPQCGVFLRRSPAMQAGVLVKCPKCAHQFRVPASLDLDAPPPVPVPPAPPQREPRAADDPAGFEPTPRRSAGQDAFDFDDADEPRGGPRRKREDDEPPRRWRADPDDRDGNDGGGEWDEEDRPRRGPRDRAAELSPDYDVDIGSWFNVATDHWPAILGPAVGFILLAGLLFFVGYFVSILLSIPLVMLGLPPLLAPVAALLLSPMFEGLTIIAFRQIRGERWQFGDFFSSPFEYYGSLLGLNFFYGLMNFLCMVPLFVIQFALGAGLVFVAGSRGGGGAASAAQLGGMMILLLPLTYLACLAGFAALYTKLGTFSVPLVIHRRFGPVEAMRGSWKLSEGHFWGLLGFNFLVGLIGFGGMLVCVGPLFLLPLASLLRVIAYARAVHLPVARPASRYDDRDDFDDEDDRPRRGRSRRDDEDDRPRGRSRRDERDDFDDEDDRPRARRSRPRREDDY